MKRLFVAALPLLAACAPLGGLPTDYDVRLDPSMTPAQSDRVLKAMDAWQQATGIRYSANVNSAYCGEDALQTKGCIHIQYIDQPSIMAMCHKNNPIPSVGCTVSYPDVGHSSNVFVSELDTEENSLRNALHEEGHAIGLSHSPSGIMCASLACSSDAITAADVAQFERNHGF
jgi:hypothetical protein